MSHVLGRDFHYHLVTIDSLVIFAYPMCWSNWVVGVYYQRLFSFVLWSEDVDPHHSHLPFHVLMRWQTRKNLENCICIPQQKAVLKTLPPHLWICTHSITPVISLAEKWALLLACINLSRSVVASFLRKLLLFPEIGHTAS